MALAIKIGIGISGVRFVGVSGGSEPVSATMWRFHHIRRDRDGNAGNLSGFRAYSVEDPTTDMIPSATVTVSSGMSLTNLLDNDFGTNAALWNAAALQGHDQRYIQVVLPQEKTLGKFEHLMWDDALGDDYYPLAFRITYSQDGGTTWYEYGMVYDPTVPNPADGNWRTYEVPERIRLSSNAFEMDWDVWCWKQHKWDTNNREFVDELDFIDNTGANVRTDISARYGTIPTWASVSSFTDGNYGTYTGFDSLEEGEFPQFIELSTPKQVTSLTIHGSGSFPYESPSDWEIWAGSKDDKWLQRIAVFEDYPNFEANESRTYDFAYGNIQTVGKVWKFEFIPFNADTVRLSGLDFFATEAMNNIANLSTASTGSGGTPSNLIDGDSGTFWETNLDPQEASVTLTFPFSRALYAFSIRGDDANKFPWAVRISYGEDTDSLQPYGIVLTNGEEDFTAPEFIRDVLGAPDTATQAILISMDNNSPTEIVSLADIDWINNSDVSVNGSIISTSSPTLQSGTYSNLYDDNVSTIIEFPEAGIWRGVASEFSSGVNLKKVSITAETVNPTRTPRDFSIGVGEGGWFEEVATLEQQIFSSGEKKTVEIRRENIQFHTLDGFAILGPDDNEIAITHMAAYVVSEIS